MYVREADDESEAQELDYAEQTQLIAKKAKLALVNRQIEELKRAKKTIASDYASADAQLMLAEVRKDFRFLCFAVCLGTFMVWGTPRTTESRVFEDHKEAGSYGPISCTLKQSARDVPPLATGRTPTPRSVANQRCCVVRPTKQPLE